MSKKLFRGDNGDVNISQTVSKVVMGVTWDDKLTTPTDLVIDLVAYGLEEDGYCRRKEDVVYFYNPLIENEREEIIKHHSLEEILYHKALVRKDREQVTITLDEVPARFQSILFCIGIYQSHQNKYNLSMINNLHARIFNIETYEQIVEHSEYQPNYFHKESCMIVGRLDRVGHVWRYTNVSKGFIGDIGTINGIYLKKGEDE